MLDCHFISTMIFFFLILRNYRIFKIRNHFVMKYFIISSVHIESEISKSQCNFIRDTTALRTIRRIIFFQSSKNKTTQRRRCSDINVSVDRIKMIGI